MARKSLRIRVGASIRSRRGALGWSQARLAEAASLSSNYVGILERGEKLPTLDALDGLARALRVSLSVLLADERPVTSWETEVAGLAAQIADEHRPIVRAMLQAAACLARPRRS